MSDVFSHLISAFIDEQICQRLWFASDQGTPPAFSYQVNFPRLELVLKGGCEHLIQTPRGAMLIEMQRGDLLYIPPNCWNQPQWMADCSVLSLLFGRRQLGCSFFSKRKDETGFFDVQKHSIPSRTGHALDNILDSLNTLAREEQKYPTDRYLVMALLSYALTMLNQPISSPVKRSEDRYQGICIYIQENFHRDLHREHIASRFNISANHLSKLFRQQGHMTLADYIIWVRIDRAKFMLKKYSFRLEEVAMRCGFHDVNYFHRVFKARTGITPSEYRRRQRSG
ncbi:helix-turn-helix transcriptional regulator [Pantoea sp. 1.19]|uniref:helix-turn-helix transcriptional regulator n=1 Tax=Pantoea sp. 1.19 TaxID=1925589 RepID=UPI0009FAD5E4|nr:AraC family transcriptional regulator [Pantoea sp. 1.19]